MTAPAYRTEMSNRFTVWHQNHRGRPHGDDRLNTRPPPTPEHPQHAPARLQPQQLDKPS